MKPITLFTLALASALAAALGCNSSTDSATNPSTNVGPVGGPVSGPADDHCAGLPPVPVDPATCHDAPSAGGTGGAGSAADPGSAGAAAAGAPDCNQTHDALYGDTLSNSEGDDDDCKYHASWTSTAIRLNEPVTITLTAATRSVDTSSTGTPLEPLAADGLLPLTRVDVYQPCDATRRGPAQNSSAKVTQTAPGVFTVGPLLFDQSGRWVVRFHLYEQCVDSDSSPHGHIAFFVDVPVP